MGQDWNRYKRQDLYRKAYEKELVGPGPDTPLVNLDEFEIDPEVIALVPPELMWKHLLVPINRAGATLVVAMAFPLNQAAIDDLEFRTGCQIEAVRATEEDIKRTLARLFKSPPPP